MTHRRLRHLRLLLAAAVLFGWLIPPALAQPPAPLTDAVEAAAVEFNLPPNLLLALGWSRSHLQDQVSRTGQVGVMQFSPAQLEQAAALLGQNQTTLQTDTAANIRAAAALLRQEADHRFPNQPALSTAGWFEVVAAVSFPADPAAGRRHARQVFTLLRDGLTVDVNGERIAIAPWPEAAALVAAPDVSIASDDYPPADWSPANAANFTPASRGAAQIDTIVIHTTEGYYQAVLNWFASPASRVSAHYVIRSSDGAIAQTVRNSDIAWHAGHWDTNQRSIGIEHEAFVSDASWYTDAMYQSSARLVRQLVQKYNIPPDRQHIIGHVEVPGCPNPAGGGASCHTDPGQFWDWDKFMALVQADDSPPTPTPTPTATVTPPPTATPTAAPLPDTTGNLIGLVVHAETNARLPGALVSAAGRTVTSNANGVYYFPGLPAGEVTLSVTLPGFAPVTHTGRVEANSTRWSSIWLTPLAEAQPPATATATPSPTPTATPSPSPQPSATPATGALVGLIQDAQTGQRLAGVTVLAAGQSYVTDERGYYWLSNLPEGMQVVTAQKAGYAAGQRQRAVIAGGIQWNSITLEPLP